MSGSHRAESAEERRPEKRGDQRREERQHTLTMPVQGERLKRCLSLCFWSWSSLLLLGLFSLHAQGHGELLQTFSADCSPELF